MPGQSKKLVYGGMMTLRAYIPLGSASQLAKAVTIAIRYSCVRHQSELQPGYIQVLGRHLAFLGMVYRARLLELNSVIFLFRGPEPQILDYQTQQYKLFPRLAAAYAYLFGSLALSSNFREVKKEIDDGKLDNLAGVSGGKSGM